MKSAVEHLCCGSGQVFGIPSSGASTFLGLFKPNDESTDSLHAVLLPLSSRRCHICNTASSRTGLAAMTDDNQVNEVQEKLDELAGALTRQCGG